MDATSPTPLAAILPTPLEPGRRGVVRTMGAMVACFLAICVMAGSAGAAEKLVLQLRWEPQFQSAGYYAALWQRYYADAGLDVEIRSAFTSDGKRLSAIEEVRQGRADFGIAAADLLVARDKGTPVVVVASIFQQSAVELYARKGTRLSSPADLTRLRVARRLNDLVDVEIQAMLRAEGIDPALVKPHRMGTEGSYFDALARGRVDVIPGYSIRTPFRAKQRRLALIRLKPVTYGVDFYGDSLFTHERLIERDPELVRRFVAATLRGWKYAFENPQDVIEGFIVNVRPTKSINDYAGLLRFQVPRVRALAQYHLVQPGHINPDRWRRMHRVLRDAGLVGGQLDLGAFIFDIERGRASGDISNRRLLFIALAAIAAIGLSLLAGALMLRRTVAIRTRALRESEGKLRSATEHAVSANRGKSRFLANMSHELRTPLNAIIGFSEVMKNEVMGRIENPQYRTYVDDIHSSGEHLLEIINDLLDLSKIEAGKFELQDEVIDIAEIGLATVRMVRPQADAAKVALEINIAPNLPMLSACPRTVRQMLINLLANSVKFTPEGGSVTLSAHVESDGKLIARVADTGIGISEQDIERVMEPFEQSQDSTTEISAGTGLGLFLVKSMMELHGGELTIESEKGVGTTMSLHFPANRSLAPLSRKKAATG